MMLEIYKAKLESIVKSVEETSGRDAAKNITRHMADEFNDTIKSLGQALPPEVAAQLPKPILSGGMNYKMGLADATYVELKSFARQALRMIEIVQKHDGASP
jgi:hypothetical protein